MLHQLQERRGRSLGILRSQQEVKDIQVYHNWIPDLNPNLLTPERQSQVIPLIPPEISVDKVSAVMFFISTVRIKISIAIDDVLHRRRALALKTGHQLLHTLLGLEDLGEFDG